MPVAARPDIEHLRFEYPAGSEIILMYMDDIQAPPPGTKGTVVFVDDAGTIHVKWETGSSLGLIPDVDKFRLVRRG